MNDVDKNELRNLMSGKLKEIDRITYEHLSYLIATKLTNTSEWKNAKTIGVTVSRFPEVDTWQLIRKGWEQGKRIVIPKCFPKEKEMFFYEITSFDQLETVYYGLFEPNIQLTNEVKDDEIDLLLVPGLAYSRNGFRLGFGGGYYDRYLTSFEGIKMSIAFAKQIVEHVPIEHHDIPVATIITEENIISCHDSE